MVGFLFSFCFLLYLYLNLIITVFLFVAFFSGLPSESVPMDVSCSIVTYQLPPVGFDVRLVQETRPLI